MLRLRGVVRQPTTQDFESRLAEAGTRSRFLVLDLSELEYVNQSGLGILLDQARLQERRGGWLRVISPSPAVGMILQLSGATEGLPVFVDEHQALDGLAA